MRSPVLGKAMLATRTQSTFGRPSAHAASVAGAILAIVSRHLEHRKHAHKRGSPSEAVVTTENLVAQDLQPLGAIDVSDPTLYQEDRWAPLFARLRREAPVHYCAASRYGPFWSVTRYNDIMAVELDHATYSSELGGIQVEDQPADMKRGSFIRLDPPRHTAQRKTVAPIAAPANLASYEVTIRQRTRAVLDELPRNETFDWVDKVSIELTTMMLATLFDFPWQERRKLTFWSDVAICNVNAPDAPVHSEAERFAELLRMADAFKVLSA